MSKFLFTNLSTKRVAFFGFLLIVLSLLIVSCQDTINEAEDPINIQQQVVLSKLNPEVRSVIGVQERHTAELLKKPDVVGTAVGLTEEGSLAILVLTKTDMYLNQLAKGEATSIANKIDNIPVRFLVVGELKAFKGRPGGGSGGVSHTAIQTAPIQLGTSGGWRYDLANGYCCGGTLGSLIEVGSTQYILSNYHVLYADIVDGGNGRIAKAGDPVIQPGLIDVQCNANNAQDVAQLVANGGSLQGSNIDAGIAEVISGMVSSEGAILEIGTISSSTIEAFIGQNVKKSGRTTGLTRSTVSGLNATVSITYDNECAGGTAFTKTFTGQVVIDNKGSKFLNSGDSGSLMVEDETSNPRAVGLLYAGSRFTAIANPIDEVLGHYKATMVGN